MRHKFLREIPRIACGTVHVGRLDDFAPDLTQRLAYVAEPIPGPVEQLWSLADAHRGVVRHSGDRKLELTDLISDGAKRLEVDLAPCGSGGIGGCRDRISDWIEGLRICSTSVLIWAIVWLTHHVRSVRRLP